MSSRQRKRAWKARSEDLLKKFADELADEEEMESSDEAPEGEDSEPIAKPKFVFSNQLQSDSSSSEEEDEGDCSEPLAPVPKPIKPKDDETQNQDDVDLDKLIEENNLVISNEQGSTLMPSMADRFDCVLCVDSQQLDVDLAMRNRFLELHDHEEAEPQRGIRRRNRVSASKRSLARKFLFSVPKVEWTKPPSFVAGGMGMQKVWQDTSTGESLFRFQWSYDYYVLNERFKMVKAAGDANVLVMFLANHPYHAEGFLLLGQVFAKLGRLDRAMDLIRRSLYCHECVFLESFKPFNGKCRLDASIEENQPFLAGLYRYMLLCATQNHTALASNLASLLLSLDPFDLHHGLLLQMDAMLLAAGRYEQLQTLCGYLPLNDFTQAEMDSSDNSVEILVGSHWNQSFCISPDEINGRATSLRELPNWWYSLALSVFMTHIQAQQQCQNNQDRDGKRSFESLLVDQPGAVPDHLTKHAASLLLCNAIRRWPHLLIALYSEIAPSSTMLRALKTHEFFQSARQR